EAEIQRDLESPHGLRSGLGLKLQRLRSRLPTSAELRAQMRHVDESIEQTRQLLTTVDLTLEDARGDYLGERTFRADLPLPLEDGAVEPREIELLRRIETDADSHINDLIELKGELELHRSKVEQLRSLIRRNVVWLR